MALDSAAPSLLTAQSLYLLKMSTSEVDAITDTTHSISIEVAVEVRLVFWISAQIDGINQAFWGAG